LRPAAGLDLDPVSSSVFGILSGKSRPFLRERSDHVEKCSFNGERPVEDVHDLSRPGPDDVVELRVRYALLDLVSRNRGLAELGSSSSGGD